VVKFLSTKLRLEAIAVGNLSFVEKLKSELGSKAAHPDSGWFKPFKPFNCSSRNA
jgi:hypothetical protein